MLLGGCSDTNQPGQCEYDLLRIGGSCRQDSHHPYRLQPVTQAVCNEWNCCSGSPVVYGVTPLGQCLSKCLDYDPFNGHRLQMNQPHVLENVPSFYISVLFFKLCISICRKCKRKSKSNFNLIFRFFFLGQHLNHFLRSRKFI